MDNNIEKIATDEAKISAYETLAPATKVKKRISLKVVTATFYSVITLLAFGLNVGLLVDAIKLTNTVTEGWDGLGKGIGLALIIVFTAIVGGAALVLYQIPFILSLTGFITSFRIKNGIIRKGRIFFSAFLALTVISEVLIAILSVAIILFIKLTNG